MNRVACSLAQVSFILTNDSNSNLSLSLIIKQTKFKYNNVSKNKLLNMAQF